MNNKGFWHCCIFVPKIGTVLTKAGSQFTGVGLAGIIIVGIVLAPCIWHYKHWEGCKKFAVNSVDRGLRQAESMWPQQLFDMLPGAKLR